MKDDYIKRTLRAYDDVDTFEQSTKKFIPIIEIDQFISYLSADSKILDAGCAFGRDTKYLSDKGFYVEGIDLSSNLIKRANELYPDISFQVKDVRDTGFADNSFDGIWCNATLIHLKDEDIKQALREFKRILKNDGVAAISFKKGEGTKELVDKFSSNTIRFFNFKTIETFKELFEEVGFEEIESHYLNERERYGIDKRELDWLYSFIRLKVLR